MKTEARGQRPFSFAVLADPHCAEDPGWAVERYGNHVDRFMKCVSAMRALDGVQRPDFMLVLGDIHFWELKKHVAKIDIPMHLIAGNHESGSERKGELRDCFPQDFLVDGRPADYYSFVHKGVRFIGICTAGCGMDHVGQLCSQDIQPRGQCEWLEGELSQAEVHKIVFAHIPPHPRGADEHLFMARNDARYLNGLVERAQPTAMFFGHQHQNTSEYRIGRTRTFTVRSCAWNFNDGPLGFMLVQVTARGVETQEVLTSDT